MIQYAASDAAVARHRADRGAYAIGALRDLCFGIVSGRLGHLDPEMFALVLLESPGTPGAFFVSRASAAGSGSV